MGAILGSAIAGLHKLEQLGFYVVRPMDNQGDVQKREVSKDMLKVAKKARTIGKSEGVNY
ncbi:hypothetical protein BGZ97_013180 [Linnemannia gamsii]|uniref:Uncharacterized protein n=1 Tax=Linnemannia gamsii TaxID=64522 RepID=A0A9P6QZF8_9FUNG|nr:hypothetical protein BGZ97_013180 [Linnemannia gamsii]